MQNNTNSLVTAPKVFSNLNYYKSHNPFYAQQQQQSFKNKHYINTVSPLQSSIHSVNNVTMATAAAVEFTDNSLPPLSHLLTTNDPVPHSQCRKWQMPSLEHHNRLKDEVFMMHPLYSSTTQPELFPHTHSVRSHHLPSPPISVVDNGMINNDGHQKTFSFIPIPGVQHKKRPRRKHHEVERLYKCNFQNCTKAYGTLNHLNAHVSMQKHGPKRQPSEFKELRKMWRKQKRENKMHQKSRDEHRLSTWSVDSQQSYAHYMPQWRPCYSPYEFMPSDY